MKGKKVYTDVYSMVTNRIIEYLEKGVVPWRKPWADAGLPRNLVTGKYYRGINVWLLSSLSYSQNDFLTFKQVKGLGGSVKKGEKAQMVIFWKWDERENKETKEIENIPILRYYKVFNIDQCAGIPKEKLSPAIERNINPLDTCERIIRGMPKQPSIRSNEQRAYYNRLDDYVNVPRIETFTSSERYYSTLFHELVHSTGHKERLNRKELLESRGLRSDDYAVEELTAEMGASYLESYAGISTEHLEDNASYIQCWLDRLRNDRKFIVYASTQAQKATDYILNIRDDGKELGYVEGVQREDNSIDNEKGRFEGLVTTRQKKSVGKELSINV